MPVNCCVFGCSTNSKKNRGLTFHGFPKNNALQNTWGVKIQQTKMITKWMKVCSLHFTDDDFTTPLNQYGLARNRFLREGAIPSKNLPSSSVAILTPKPRQRKICEIPTACAESDPLAITPADNLALFGGSMENIEFVVESDEDCNDLEIKDDSIVIEINDLEEQHIEEIVNRKQVLSIPCITLGENQIIDLDALEVKDEIKVKEEDIKPILEYNKQYQPMIYETLENVNQGVSQKNRCYVPDCTSGLSILNSQNEDDKVYWFSVPVDANLKQIWDICIGCVDKRLTSEDVVCHKHFSGEDIIHPFTIPNFHNDVMVSYDQPKLRQGAVPCVKFHKECCVPNCRRTTGKMYCFPVLRSSDFNLWMYMIKNPILKNLPMKEVLRYRVCDIHFDSDCFDDDFSLKRTAAPTLQVPENYTLDLAKVKPLSGEKAVNNVQGNIILVCAHGECPNRSNCGKNLFRFPTDADRCIAWLKSCGRNNLISSPIATLRKMSHLRLGVCEDHFDLQDFEATMDVLKPDAIPKPYLELGIDFRKSKAFSSDQKIGLSEYLRASNIAMQAVGENTIPSGSNSSKSYVGICAYGSCQSKQTRDNPFFSFPSDTERSEKWLRACGLIKSKHNLTNMQICSKHFGKDTFDPLNRLKHDAIPIIYSLHKKVDDKKIVVENSSVPVITKRQQRSEHSSTSVEPNANNTIEQQITRHKSTSIKNDTQNVKEQLSEMKNKSYIYCAVECCPNFYDAKYSNSLKFPDPIKDSERFDIWLRLVANPKLANLSRDEIYSKYLVCVRHFETHFYRKDGKAAPLSQEAVPTKNLTVDCQWFFTSEYYKTRLQNYYDSLTAEDFHEDATIKWKEDDIQDVEELDDRTRCVLEKDRIRFPGMGHYLYMGKRVNLNKRKVPYNVYNYFNTGYGLNNYVEVGENIRIHTAIVIDDDDDCERQVLQLLLDKRRKNS